MCEYLCACMHVHAVVSLMCVCVTVRELYSCIFEAGVYSCIFEAGVYEWSSCANAKRVVSFLKAIAAAPPNKWCLL